MLASIQTNRCVFSVTDISEHHNLKGGGGRAQSSFEERRFLLGVKFADGQYGPHLNVW